MFKSFRPVPLQLFLRLLMPDPFTSDKGEFWLEQMPKDLPVELPLPRQFQIIASLQQKNSFFVILIKIPQSPSTIQCWYSNRLRALGWYCWQADEIFFNLNSFGVPASASNNPLTSLLTFCYRPKSLTLTLQTRRIGEHNTYVKLKITADKEFHSPCQASWERSILNMLPMPQLVPPLKTKVQKKRAGGTIGEWLSEAKIQTSLNGFALLAHYKAQLIQAGWTQRTSDHREQLLWSVWTLDGVDNKVWKLVLSFIGNRTHSNIYTAYLQILNLKDLERICLPAQIIEPINSSESIPEEILWQFLSEDLSSDGGNKQLWIGELPPEIPRTLEFPESTKVLGYLAEENNKSSLLLEIDLSPKQILEYFTKQLVNLGWQKFNILKGVEDFGFATSRLPRLTLTEFFNPTDGIELLVRLYSTTSNCTDVRLRWLPKSGSGFHPPEESNQSTLQERLNQTPIPTLKLPEQTEVVKGPSKIHEQRFKEIVFINTVLVPELLHNHYLTEMQRLGWQQQIISQREKHHFSLWFFTDKLGQSWQGFLNLLSMEEEPNKYIGQLKIELLDSLDSIV